MSNRPEYRYRLQENEMKIATKRLDKLFSDFIRRRAILRVDGCEKCLTPKYGKQKEDGSILPTYKQLQCSHYWGKWTRSVRWDEDNAAGLCGACHLFLGSHPEEHKTFFLERLGQDGYDELMLRANSVNKVDYTAIEIYLRQKTQELQAAISADKL